MISPIRDSPFSAEAVTEFTQTLGDGNRIERRYASSLARDSRGRTRRQEEIAMVGPLAVNGPAPRLVTIHDPEAGLDYATRLLKLKERLSDQLLIVMRVYFEKPRTTVGWKGLINDPHLDGSFDIPAGIRKARQLLRDVADNDTSERVRRLATSMLAR